MEFTIAFAFFNIVAILLFVEQSVIGYKLQYTDSNGRYYPGPWYMLPYMPANQMQRNEFCKNKKAPDEDSLSLRSTLNDDDDLPSQQSLFPYYNGPIPHLIQQKDFFSLGFNPFIHFPATRHHAEEQAEVEENINDNINLTVEQQINNHTNWKYIDRELCGETIADRIIGGTEASLGQYPWLALFGYKNGHLDNNPAVFSCGGALINPCWILSATHCVSDLPRRYYIAEIRLGEHNLNTDIDCNDNICADPVQIFTPAKIITHNSYNTPKLKNDISLTKLDRPAMLTQWVVPICLPYGNLLSTDLVGQVGEVAGWGINSMETKQASKILRTVKLAVVNHDRCQETFKKKAHIGKTQICVGGQAGRDSCNGDSGGPFMKVDVVNGSTPKYYVFGVVSFGTTQCGAKPTPGVYTNVSSYMKWILDRVSLC